jgi:NADPH-dependent ferric siderophore reductase
MSMSELAGEGQRSTGRRRPPPFRHVQVKQVSHLSLRMARVVLGGSDLDGFSLQEPAASVRLLLPPTGTSELLMPEWNGNEFLFDDGARPIIRTFTPRNFDERALELTLDMVIHEGGAASSWVEAAGSDAPAAVSGPGRGYKIDHSASEYVLAGDETAIPAMAQLLEHIPTKMPVRVHIEIADPGAQLPLPHHPLAAIEWHVLGPGAAPGDAVVAAVEAADLASGCQIWCAGEAAAMHRIRTDLFKQRGLPRSAATVRGYWKRGAVRGEG